jgi:hypothetical protein
VDLYHSTSFDSCVLDDDDDDDADDADDECDDVDDDFDRILD